VRERDARALGARRVAVPSLLHVHWLQPSEYDLTPGVLHVKHLPGVGHELAATHLFDSHTWSLEQNEPEPQQSPAPRRHAGVPSATPAGSVTVGIGWHLLSLHVIPRSHLTVGATQPHILAPSQRYCGHGVVMHCFGSSKQTWSGAHGLAAQALVSIFSQRNCGHGVVMHCFGSSMQRSPTAHGLEAQVVCGAGHVLTSMHLSFSHTSPDAQVQPAPQHSPPERTQPGVPSSTPTGSMTRGIG
jgi:hypothetical protein